MGAILLSINCLLIQDDNETLGEQKMTGKWEYLSKGIWRQKNSGSISSAPTEPDVRLAEEGFPKKVSEAFQKAADELNCVIWSRVPG